MNIFGKSKFLLAVVFLTGACVLVIEILAVRMLSPYFGNTIFSVSSVLAVILLALSLGYYFGGILADKFPRVQNFYGLIFFSGLTVFLIHILNTAFVPYLGYVLPVTYGPLVVSALLFLIPAIILGSLSPFVIKLVSVSLPNAGVGSISGKVFFFSTLGSISGSLFSGFFLIPNFGASQILIGVGIILSGLGFLPLLFDSKRVLFLGFLIVALSLSFGIKPTKAENILYEAEGIYSKLVVLDMIYRERPARVLLMDKNNSSAMIIGSDDLAFPYARYYRLYKLIVPEAKRFLVIGGGAYSVPGDILKDTIDTEVHVSEIEPTLIDVARKYFLLPESDRLINHVVDGRRFLHDSEEKFDFVFGDSFASLYSVPTHMTTLEFYETLKEKLSPGGATALNLIGNLEEGEVSFILSEIKTFKKVFPNSYFFAVTSKDYKDAQNIIFFGINGDTKLDFSPKSLEKTGDPFLFDLYDHLIQLSTLDLNKYPIITDDYAPVDYLISKVLN